MGQELRKFDRTSASQDAAFQRCQRYWWYGWIMAIRSPPTDAQQRGTDIHTEIEHYLKTGEVRDSAYTPSYAKKPQNYRPYVEAVVPHLPPPDHDELVVEFKVLLDTPLGPNSWLGFIDVAFSGCEPIKLLDTKSTSDFRYCKTPEELRTKNIQLASYSKAVYEMGHQGDIEVGHIYVKTGKRVPKKPKTKLVTAITNLGEVNRQWDEAMARVELMSEAALALDGQDLPPTPSACGMYGGCPFQSKCGLVGENKLAGFFNKKSKEKENEKMANSFLARLKGNKKKSNGVGALPPDAPSRETPVEAKGDVPESPPAEKKKKTTKKKTTKKKTTKKKTTGTLTGFTLFIDCVPVKGGDDAVQFEDWMAPVFESMNETVKSEKNLPSYLLLPFSEEKAMISLAVTEKIGELPSTMVVHSSSPGARDALGVLIPHAAVVVRATRG